jgi:hypothetical protein
MATNNQPTHTLRCGNIKATIWQNVSENDPFFATTFSRPFKDQSGVWRSVITNHRSGSGSNTFGSRAAPYLSN